MTRLNKRDAADVRRLRDLLERYRPGAPPVADEFIRELEPIVGGEGFLAMRPVQGELGWSLDFLNSTVDPGPLREFLAKAGFGWSPFFPVTPAPLRNRAVRPKVLHRELIRTPPSAAYRETLEFVERNYGMASDDLGVSICDGDVVLGWFGTSRGKAFGRRELAIVDALVPALRTRMLAEHQLGYGLATQGLLEVALEAIPAAAYILAGARIAHANATGRFLFDTDRSAVLDKLRESLRGDGSSPFAITRVVAPCSVALSLAVLRSDGAGELDKRLTAFTAHYGLTRRQREVLSLLARGYGNKTIAEKLGVTEGTVEEHVTMLFHKTRAKSRASLVAKLWTD